jgi:hypothetical protein
MESTQAPSIEFVASAEFAGQYYQISVSFTRLSDKATHDIHCNIRITMATRSDL